MTQYAGSKTVPSAIAQVDEGYTRLHIAPLDPQLLSLIVPPATLSKARAISYHTIQTFPERPYGFINLPNTDAYRIKRKLNGAILKGSKLRIEPARPADMPKLSPATIADTALAPDSVSNHTTSAVGKRNQNKKRGPQEIIGIELEKDRKVKRGWTVTAEAQRSKNTDLKHRESAKPGGQEQRDKKDKRHSKREPASQYTAGPECLFKTRLPPNKQAVLDHKQLLGGAEKRKHKKHKDHQLVIHEFEKTTKYPTFFKVPPSVSISKGTPEYVEGKGWVDDNGQVVEEVKSIRPLGQPRAQVAKTHSDVELVDDEPTSSCGSPSEDRTVNREVSETDKDKVNSKTTSSPGLRPFSNHSSVSTGSSAWQLGQARPKSSASSSSLRIKIASSTAPGSTEVHPLEALYKLPRQGAGISETEAPESRAFTFLSGNDLDKDEIAHDQRADEPVINKEASTSSIGHSQGKLPMTPFTKQDFEWRGMRSAAPTPDTAYPDRMSGSSSSNHEQNSKTDDTCNALEGLEASSNPRGDGTGSDATHGPADPNLDFQNWFWEHRGDLVRSWKKRRKNAKKEKRYRENKARADRAI